jgi:hypothetical protein
LRVKVLENKLENLVKLSFPYICKVWIAMQIRRKTLVDFFLALVKEHQHSASEKPSPTFQALLQGELEQQTLRDVKKEEERVKQVIDNIHSY